jgi:hypothetical protein
MKRAEKGIFLFFNLSHFLIFLETSTRADHEDIFLTDKQKRTQQNLGLIRLCEPVSISGKNGNNPEENLNRNFELMF